MNKLLAGMLLLNSEVSRDDSVLSVQPLRQITAHKFASTRQVQMIGCIIIDTRDMQTVWVINCVGIRLNNDIGRLLDVDHRLTLIICGICVNLSTVIIGLLSGAYIVLLNLILDPPQQVCRAFIIPSDWDRMQRMEWLNTISFSSDFRFLLASSMFNMSLDSAPTGNNAKYFYYYPDEQF